jgi:hypothetical protein
LKSLQDEALALAEVQLDQLVAQRDHLVYMMTQHTMPRGPIVSLSGV